MEYNEENILLELEKFIPIIDSLTHKSKDLVRIRNLISKNRQKAVYNYEDFKEGDKVEFDQLCPHCQTLERTIKGFIDSLNPEENKFGVTTYDKYTGTDEYVRYSVKLENLRKTINVSQ